MRKSLLASIVASIVIFTAACGDSPTTGPSLTPSSTAVYADQGGRSSIRQAGIQCSDAPVRWITTSFSPVGRSARVYWEAVQNVNIYQLEVYHTRDEQRFPKTFVGYVLAQGIAEATLGDPEDGGRYFVRVRVVNTCGLPGEWSSVLIIYMDGQPNEGGSEGPVYVPPTDGDDDDGNNGHGNDDDGDDDSNPGGGNDSDEPCTDEDDGNNGHGNDCDKDDDSNPSGH